ncbi:hypothetical protein CAPTEDRAFT_207007 [Capitella teleta]|uniref:GOLD domain-containing protein n=1 Tax=Capitella teleta TaxID=283909 RepID=R7UZR2_CAPTE|nr:hypothetical protein CAPTEDRAFT_207007 [Capitella teleta]|eukprot:ELU08931.1 hypothetical protein CAPTEDRAFT_207007 [Capitella teleta]
MKRLIQHFLASKKEASHVPKLLVKFKCSSRNGLNSHSTQPALGSKRRLYVVLSRIKSAQDYLQIPLDYKEVMLVKRHSRGKGHKTSFYLLASRVATRMCVRWVTSLRDIDFWGDAYMISCKGKISLINVCVGPHLVVVIFLASPGISAQGGKAWSEDPSMVESVGRIGTSFPFKVTVEAQDIECYYETMDYDSHIYLSFTVVRGGDRRVNVLMKDQYGLVLERLSRETTGSVEEKCAEPDGCTISICFDNIFSRFTRKHVDVLIMTWKPHDWLMYETEAEMWGLTANQTLNAANSIMKASIAVRKSFSTYRRRTLHYLSLANRIWSAVNNFSIFLCALIIITSGLQTIFVKRLFRNVHKTKV